MTAPERSPAQTAREVGQVYRRRYGRDRPAPRWDTDARAAWQAAHRAGGHAGAWTHTPIPSAVVLLTTLAEHRRPVSGTALARAAGVSQGRATSVTLPRFAELGLAEAASGTPVRPGTRAPTLWTITPAGAELADTMRRGEA